MRKRHSTLGAQIPLTSRPPKGLGPAHKKVHPLAKVVEAGGRTAEGISRCGEQGCAHQLDFRILSSWLGV